MSEDAQQAAPAENGASPRRAFRGPKRRRSLESRNRPAPWTLAIVAGIILLLVAGVYGYRVFSARLEAVKRIDEATALIENADAIVVQVDSVVRERVTAELAEPARSAAKRVPAAKTDLEKAVRLLDEARLKGSSADKKRIDLLVAAASARIDMLGQAPVVLDLNSAASDVLTVARDAWEGVIAADKLSDRAVASYNKLTKAGVKGSRTLNKQAATKLSSARKKFDTAEKSFPEAPFETYLAYVDARIALNKLSQRSDAAWLKGDVKTANSVISTYNKEDKRAVVQAKALPASPEQAIADAYETAAKEPTDAYYAAREAATKADAALRAGQ